MPIQYFAILTSQLLKIFALIVVMQGQVTKTSQQKVEQTVDGLTYCGALLLAFFLDFEA